MENNAKQVGTDLSNKLFDARQVAKTAYGAWEKDPTDANKKAYEEAEKAVHEASTAHNAHIQGDHTQRVTRKSPSTEKVDGAFVTERFDEQSHLYKKTVTLPQAEEAPETKEEAPETKEPGAGGDQE